MAIREVGAFFCAFAPDAHSLLGYFSRLQLQPAGPPSLEEPPIRLITTRARSESN